LALGRLANYSEELAESVVAQDVLPQLIYSLAEQNRFYKKTASYVLKCIAKHSPELAQAVVDAGALDALAGCLLEFEPSVKESAAWALSFISRHNGELAQSVVDSGAIPHLVLCLQEPELALKRIAASCLGEIAKHSAELAQIVVDAGAVSVLAPLIQHTDAKLKRQVCSTLSQIAKHSVDLAEVVVEAEIFPKIYHCLRDSDRTVRKHAATCIREIAKHTAELAQLIVNTGGHGALIDYITDIKGDARVAGITALGYIGTFSETLALAIIVGQGLVPLKDALVNEPEDYVRAAAAWTLGQLGSHSPDHAKALAVADIYRRLVDVCADEKSPADLQLKAEKALAKSVLKCTHLQALEPLVHSAPPRVSKYVVQQFAKVLPNQPKARKSFVQSRCLARVQEIESDGGDLANELQEHIEVIKNCFPQDVVQYYAPNYSETLLQQLDDAEA
jgi:sperm-associated antigen 6